MLTLVLITLFALAVWGVVKIRNRQRRFMNGPGW
jgi:hypothetical protein